MFWNRLIYVLSRGIARRPRFQRLRITVPRPIVGAGNSPSDGSRKEKRKKRLDTSEQRGWSLKLRAILVESSRPSED